MPRRRTGGVCGLAHLIMLLRSDARKRQHGEEEEEPRTRGEEHPSVHGRGRELAWKLGWGGRHSPCSVHAAWSAKRSGTVPAAHRVFSCTTRRGGQAHHCSCLLFYVLFDRHFCLYGVVPARRKAARAQCQHEYQYVRCRSQLTAHGAPCTSRQLARPAWGFCLLDAVVAVGHKRGVVAEGVGDGALEGVVGAVHVAARLLVA